MTELNKAFYLAHTAQYKEDIHLRPSTKGPSLVFEGGEALALLKFCEYSVPDMHPEITLECGSSRSGRTSYGGVRIGKVDQTEHGIIIAGKVSRDDKSFRLGLHETDDNSMIARVRTPKAVFPMHAFKEFRDALLCEQPRAVSASPSPKQRRRPGRAAEKVQR
jgi:hypothetical protein